GKAGKAGGRGAAGRGAATGAAGAGSRRRGKDRDREARERDLFDDGNGWIDDEGVAPEVLD
ncbi:hypothetical protein, partial [Nocardioides sp.]|uniref:hypothetical protein n=1 Tax=Nocardioides sp. TaxID=35761 RepID=UPI00271C3DA0